MKSSWTGIWDPWNTADATAGWLKIAAVPRKLMFARTLGP